jgi:CubicO group peptidase (beta-lactamase class C family)
VTGEGIHESLAGLDESVAVSWAVGVGDSVAGFGSRGVSAPGGWFDLASLTKPLVTAPVVLTAMNQRGVPLDSRVDDLFPAWRARPDRGSRQVTVEHLLTHAAGLPATVDASVLTAGQPAVVRAAVLQAPLLTAPGSRLLYSDVGYVLAAWATAALTRQPWDALVADHVRSLGLPSRVPWDAVVPLPGVPVGSAHDPMARILGGVQGHAGAFGGLGEVRAMLGWWLDQGPIVQSQALRVRRDSHAGSRTCGWAAHGDAWYILPPQWPVDSVCHTGFTGTSAAWHPPTGSWAVLLTDAVRLGPDKPGLTEARRAFHMAAARTLGLQSDGD